MDKRINKTAKGNTMNDNEIKAKLYDELRSAVVDFFAYESYSHEKADAYATICEHTSLRAFRAAKDALIDEQIAEQTAIENTTDNLWMS